MFALFSATSNRQALRNPPNVSQPGRRKLERRILGRSRGAAIKLDAQAKGTHDADNRRGVGTTMTGRLAGLRPGMGSGTVSKIASFPVIPGIQRLTILKEIDDDGASEQSAAGVRQPMAPRRRRSLRGDAETRGRPERPHPRRSGHDHGSTRRLGRGCQTAPRDAADHPGGDATRSSLNNVANAASNWATALGLPADYAAPPTVAIRRSTPPRGADHRRGHHRAAHLPAYRGGAGSAGNIWRRAA